MSLLSRALDILSGNGGKNEKKPKTKKTRQGNSKLSKKRPGKKPSRGQGK